MRLSKREFTRNIFKYITDGEYILTNHGEDEYKVIVTTIQGNSGAKEQIVTTLDKNVTTISRYGCGCIRADERLCSKHGRA